MTSKSSHRPRDNARHGVPPAYDLKWTDFSVIDKIMAAVDESRAVSLQ